MFIKVRTIDGKTEKSLEISKLMTIKDFKTTVAKNFSTKLSSIQLYYRGKRLENNYRICNYKLNYQDVVQLVIQPENHAKPSANNVDRPSPQRHLSSKTTHYNKNNNNNNNELDSAKMLQQPTDLKQATSCWYQVGDLIDCIDDTHGAWFEATIQNIFHSAELNKLIYRVEWSFLPNDDDYLDVEESRIRPRAKINLSVDEIKVGMRVMINYNIEDVDEDGYWYDFTVGKILKNRWGARLVGTIHVGNGVNETSINNCKVNPKEEIFLIEKPIENKRRHIKTNKNRNNNKNHNNNNNYNNEQKQRRVAITCKTCLDDKTKKCKACGCNICSGKQNPRLMILCDECDKAYHTLCLTPPLTQIPEDDWYCPVCKNDDKLVIKAGEKLPPSKIEMKTELKKGQKDWGRGMGCMGRMKECTIVPITHRGPVPGIEVGMSWKYRLQVSEAGVHRPHVAGIHGRESECAYSLVLSGGYEDDVDDGDEFYYTGSGGRDLTGNKRTAAQSSDQTLTKMNKALALNCNAKFNDVEGATSSDWKNGIPVRVVRAAKMSKHKAGEKYAPQQGFRYDGIYKVVRYFPENGKSGFKIWRYVLRRDDPIPAPWTVEGKARIKSLGLKMIDCNLLNKNSSIKKHFSEKVEKNIEDDNKKSQGDRRLKRLRNELIEDGDDKEEEIEGRKIKRSKSAVYELDKGLMMLIKRDKANGKLWKDCCSVLSKGKIAFLDNIVDRFTCVCCQELVWKPTTTPCHHNICQTCLKRSFKADVYCCPICRHSLNETEPIEVNKLLSAILENLYPGYGSGRK